MPLPLRRAGCSVVSSHRIVTALVGVPPLRVAQAAAARKDAAARRGAEAREQQRRGRGAERLARLARRRLAVLGAGRRGLQLVAELECVLAILAAFSVTPALANPIIQRDQQEIQRAQQVTGSELNSPVNGGSTTLRQKCEALQYFQNRMDFGGVMNMSFQIGFEHPIGRLSVDQACSKVGVNTYL